MQESQHLYLVMLDITERSVRRRKVPLAVEASPSAIVMFDEQAKILLVNVLTSCSAIPAS